jgi:hypothetical protein
MPAGELVSLIERPLQLVMHLVAVPLGRCAQDARALSAPAGTKVRSAREPGNEGRKGRMVP